MNDCIYASVHMFDSTFALCRGAYYAYSIWPNMAAQQLTTGRHGAWASSYGPRNHKMYDENQR